MDSLHQLRVANSTMLVVHGDHGIGLGGRGEWGKGGQRLNEETLRVALLLHVPWLHVGLAGPPQTVYEAVELISLAPTLSELFGVDMGRLGLEGRSLLPLLTKAPGRKPLHTHPSVALTESLNGSSQVWYNGRGVVQRIVWYKEPPAQLD